jgi:hypothetical protein
MRGYDFGEGQTPEHALQIYGVSSYQPGRETTFFTARPTSLRTELAAAGDNMKKLREIARVHIARCEAGDMQAIKELADRLDGKPAQILEHSGTDSNPIKKIVREIVYMPPPGEIEPIEDMPQPPLEITFVRSDGNGSGGPNS